MVIPPTAPYRAYWRKLEQKKPTAQQRALITRARRQEIVWEFGSVIYDADKIPNTQKRTPRRDRKTAVRAS